jgi:hypothetical protein
MKSRSAGFLPPGGLAVLVVADMLPGPDGDHRGGQHDEEAEHAEQRVYLHAADQAADPDQEDQTGQGRAAAVHAAGTSASQGVGELGILGREGGFHLFEESLFVLREGHCRLLDA